ncbi:MAG: pentapeptide repeat-containing protein [Pyrinomonadaceae bacterium]
MANSQHLDILMQGVDVWNKWREENHRLRPDLSGASLGGAYLRRAYLRNVNLSGADLHTANLQKATLSKSDLSNADLSNAKLRSAYLRKANLAGANLSKSDLTNANLVDSNIDEANLEGCTIYGVSAWNVEGFPLSQSNLIITRENESVITVDDLEVAQFIYLLLNHKKLRNVINSVTERGVLLLGRFGDGGINILQALSAKLREFNYLPIIFDFERPRDRDYTETIKTLASLSRFVIADLSGPSVPQELYATVPHFKIPFVPIIEAGRKKYSMFTDLLGYPWVIQPVEFTTIQNLTDILLANIVTPAEERARQRQELLEQLFGN